MSVASPSTPPAPSPRYRFFTVPPATVRLPVDDITALLPAGAWTGSDADKRRDLALPASEILEGNFPRIRFARLRDLLPGCIQPVANAPEWIVLPTDRVALAYRPETRSELIPEASPPPPASAELPSPPSATGKPAAGQTAPAPVNKPVPGWRRLLKPILAPPPSAPSPPLDETDSESPASVLADSPAPVPVGNGTAPELPATIQPPPLPSAAPAPVPLAGLRFSPEIETRLQQAFMTEENLSITRLVDLAGGLPGLQGCILARGAEFVAATGTPAGLDLPALTSGAGRILDELAAKGTTSGLHFKPAVTVYAESGPISFLRHGDIALLVTHRERGFLPGVREKLEIVLDAIPAA